MNDSTVHRADAYLEIIAPDDALSTMDKSDPTRQAEKVCDPCQP